VGTAWHESRALTQRIGRVACSALSIATKRSPMLPSRTPGPQSLREIPLRAAHQFLSNIRSFGEAGAAPDMIDGTAL
jgi:hypothetical protein